MEDLSFELYIFNVIAEAEGLEPPNRLLTDQCFSRAPDYQLSHASLKSPYY